MQKTAVEMLRATNPEDVERWRTLVQGSAMPDVYYLPAYALATSQIEHSEPLALVAGSDSCKVLAPLLIRRMTTFVDDSKIDWVDACSPYGYGGYLNLSSKGDVDDHDLNCFFEDLHNWCCDRHVVCCVLRLHPLAHQEEWFMPERYSRKFLRIQFRGSTSGIDLNNWDAALDQPKGLRRDRRSDLRHARRTLRVTWTEGEDRDVEVSLNLFSQIYNQALARHGANDFYRFPPSYFSHLAALGRHLSIAFVWLENELVGANIFLAGWHYAHGHLAGTNETGLKNGASTLLIIEGCKWARQRGCELLHLGGGNSPSDSLEDYKRSFGGPSYRYAYLNYIVDPERFEQLSRMPHAPWPYSADGT